MISMLTKEQAKIIFISGMIFFICLFVALIFETSFMWLQNGTPATIDLNTKLGRKIAYGKKLWERYNCIGCHTLIGEGAYFAPELGNAYLHYNNDLTTLKKLIEHRPGEDVTAYRMMPKFNLSEFELNALVEFLKINAKIYQTHWSLYKYYK
ncbi:hypothetical protein TI05_07200 [Achromatium sp. WMS3]|jgi:nitric oxide reductase subunit C|nr:hypothetical protein TI05_07200 [Achromatium sp. WMS3]